MAWYSVLTDEEAAARTVEVLDRQFPKQCAACRCVYPTLRHYIQNTRRIGAVQAPDATSGDWEPQDPSGVLGFANCPCGSTLALTSDGMGLVTMWQILRWVRDRMQRHGLTYRQVAKLFVRSIDRHVFADVAGIPRAPPAAVSQEDRAR